MMDKIDRNEIEGQIEVAELPLTREQSRWRLRMVLKNHLLYAALLGLGLIARCQGDCAGQGKKEEEPAIVIPKPSDFPEECASENGENRAKEFLGAWIKKSVNRWDNEAFSVREVKSVSDLKSGDLWLDGKKAILCIRINIPELNFLDEKGVSGGIYRWNDKLCMILWCKACSHNIIIDLQKGEKAMELGMPNTFNSNSLSDKMVPDHCESDFHSNPQKWIKYGRPAQNPKSK